MRGRPKLPDSRNNQYRIRLNDEENQKLEYVSTATGKPKSEIFRLALIEYYNQVRLNEINNAAINDEWEISGISLKRVVECPYCMQPVRIDVEDECSTSQSDRPMGNDCLYEFDYEDTCPKCDHVFRVSGYISEYPLGSFEHEEIKVSQIKEEEL